MKKIKADYRNRTGLELARHCARVAMDTKAEDLVIMDVRGISSFTDYFVVMSGRSTRHVQGLADAIESEFRSKRLNPKNCEGLREGHWVLLDFHDVVVHIFYTEKRKFYDLEGLWHDAPRVPMDPQGE